ncbi:MAG: protein kinase [Nannocystaceae bacterium]
MIEADTRAQTEAEATRTTGVQRATEATVRLKAAAADDALRRAAVELPTVSVSDRVVHDSLRAKLFGRAPEPTRIGRFVIVRRIGAGGMGVVYSAFDEELDRKVAIKLLHAERSGTQGRARILREAQAVARISHPNIIHVYEVGELETGQVFMAMEFVEGVTLDEWVHRKERSWREVLAVYLQAAQGLAAAHEAGLIHRDVKPENILINSRGRVIILDFGLARLHSDNDASNTLDPSGGQGITGGALPDPAALTEASAETIAQTLTASGAIMGTPAYMSPEQCTGLPADARSDQFSFCVSLYEGLYGERPYAGESLSKLILAVCQGNVREPPRGTRVPTWLRRVLLRGLAVKPSERWPSMQALAEALARDPARHRRRWLGVGAIAASLVMGVVGTIQPWSSGGICRGADERLHGVWDSSRKAAVREALLATGYAYAEQSWPILEDRFDRYTRDWAAMYARACETHQRGETSAELYDRQMACLDARLGEVDSMVDVLAAADATVLQQAPEMVNGLVPLVACGDTESLRESYAPPPDQKTADAVRSLRQQIVDIRVRAEAGHGLEVVDAAEGVVRAAKTLGYRPLLAEALFQLGAVNLRLPTGNEAEKALLSAFLTADAVRHDGIAAEAGAWLVFLNARAGRETEAKLRAEHVKAVIERYGRTTVADVNLHRGLATLEFVNGRYDEARRGLRHALAIAESLPEGEGERLATLIHVNIGQVCEIQGDAACMSSNYERAMERISSRLGPDDPKLSMYQYMLAKARSNQGRYDEARELVERGIAQTRKAFGERHPLYVENLAWAAEVMIFEGKLETAERYVAEAIDLSASLYDKAHETVYLDAMMAGILRFQGRYAEALDLIERAQGRVDEGADADAAEKIRNKLLLKRGEILHDLGRYAEAKADFEAVLASEHEPMNRAGPYRAFYLVGVARTESKLGDDARAAELLVEARQAVSEISDEHWALVEPLSATAEIALKLGHREEALAAAEHALRILERAGCSRLELPRVRFLVARALLDAEPERAVAMAEKALVEEAGLERPAPERRAEIEAWLAEHRG